MLGALAHIRLPSPLAKRLVCWFAGRYGANIAEAELPLENYPSIGDFFVRTLKAGARPMPSDPETLVSPVDGMLREAATIEVNGSLTVKGVAFDWPRFLGSEELAGRYVGGTFFNLYLSPKDYHRVHFPVSGELRSCVHIPGGLLPVNDWSVSRFPNLFCYNERVVAELESPLGPVVVVMIGALNVGSIRLDFAENWRRGFFSSQPSAVRVERHTFERGERFGVFRLGSSVVVLTKKALKPAGALPRAVLLGQALTD